MDDKNFQNEIQEAYQEFSEALQKLRSQQQELFRIAAEDLESQGLKKLRKQISTHE